MENLYARQKPPRAPPPASFQSDILMLDKNNAPFRTPIQVNSTAQQERVARGQSGTPLTSFLRQEVGSTKPPTRRKSFKGAYEATSAPGKQHPGSAYREGESKNDSHILVPVPVQALESSYNPPTVCTPTLPLPSASTLKEEEWGNPLSLQSPAHANSLRSMCFEEPSLLTATTGESVQKGEQMKGEGEWEEGEMKSPLSDSFASGGITPVGTTTTAATTLGGPFGCSSSFGSPCRADLSQNESPGMGSGCHINFPFGGGFSPPPLTGGLEAESGGGCHVSSHMFGGGMGVMGQEDRDRGGDGHCGWGGRSEDPMQQMEGEHEGPFGFGSSSSTGQGMGFMSGGFSVSAPGGSRVPSPFRHSDRDGDREGGVESHPFPLDHGRLSQTEGGAWGHGWGEGGYDERNHSVDSGHGRTLCALPGGSTVSPLPAGDWGSSLCPNFGQMSSTVGLGARDCVGGSMDLDMKGGDGMGCLGLSFGETDDGLSRVRGGGPLGGGDREVEGEEEHGRGAFLESCLT
uniref:Uncharacterized protein n=1 Tax=Chromera velia CCMP2878 TaxID=1169474 RepID=A0A0G4I1Z0_9ALVE|eukprot:Cvel_10265.t1-p1 / transcript=Cvel_10265.t1 / gene=Cvel_10265 / organism=Chromera_velia_CCMP2878 / gene_product=hypothetical protein / transcript_product=hypothetical protein / location=Cvel_scaffold615:44823-46370(+) / protein_length=516 / sequence_SO=supercontig / SO=protein_coding / is_pseudo=false